LLDRDRLASPPQFEHYILRDFLGECAFSDNGFSHPNEMCVVIAENRVERGFIPTPDTLL
jgi:hypothetical protein